MGREVSRTDRREVRLHLSGRGRTFLTDLRSRREAALRAVLEQMPAAGRSALLTGLESFCTVAASQLQGEVDTSPGRTA